MFLMDFCRRVLSRREVHAALALVLFLMLVPGLAWGAAGTAQGSASPFPEDSHPELGQIYNVVLDLQNTSKSAQGGPFAVTVTAADLLLACKTSGCPAGTGLPGAVTFEPTSPNLCELGSDPCVEACTAGTDAISGADTVVLTLNNCVLGPSEDKSTFAIIRVKQTATVGSFVMSGSAALQSAAGTCTLNGNTRCTNAPAQVCSQDKQCDFHLVTGTSTGTANLTPSE